LFGPTEPIHLAYAMSMKLRNKEASWTPFSLCGYSSSYGLSWSLPASPQCMLKLLGAAVLQSVSCVVWCGVASDFLVVCGLTVVILCLSCISSLLLLILYVFK
jgi:hypothetical protein